MELIVGNYCTFKYKNKMNETKKVSGVVTKTTFLPLLKITIVQVLLDDGTLCKVAHSLEKTTFGAEVEILIGEK